MRRIDMEPYEVNVQVPVLGEDGQAIGQKTVVQPYAVRRSLELLLFNQNQQLTADQALTRDELKQKIRCTAADVLLLEAAEYEQIVAALDAARGFGENDVEFIRRIKDAPDVEVEEKADEEGSEGEDENSGEEAGAEV
jgi:hypothetical protein